MAQHNGEALTLPSEELPWLRVHPAVSYSNNTVYTVKSSKLRFGTEAYLLKNGA